MWITRPVLLALLNYGITKSPFLAACLREIFYVLAKYNIEIRAEYIPSKDNCLADLCSRAFTNETFFNNFNKLLHDQVLILEDVNYNLFLFDLEI